MNTISLITANYVAREVGYQMTGGWMHGDDATSAYFAPIATFPERFDALLREVKDVGVTSLDLWSAHLHPLWATPEHVAAAQAALKQHGLTVASVVGYMGKNLDELRTVCRLANALGTNLLSGRSNLLQEARADMVALLRSEGAVFAFENHPETSVDQVLQALGQGDEDVIGVAVDTGWFGTCGVNAAEAIAELKGRIFHIHLKDVKARRAEPTGFQMIDMGHETCRFGEGIVPLEACVKRAVADGFTGPISIEHEPEDFNPREDMIASRDLLESWLSA